MVGRPYFPSKPLKLDYIYFHVGRVTMLWADVEESVDRLVSIFARVRADPLFVHPISTKRRIKEFRRLMKLVRLSDEARAKGEDLIARFANLAWYRHWISHGTLDTASIKGETWRANGGMVDYCRQNLSTREREWHGLHVCDIEAMGDEALELLTGFTEWMAYDLGCSTPKRTEKFCREGGMRLA